MFLLLLLIGTSISVIIYFIFIYARAYIRYNVLMEFFLIFLIFIAHKFRPLLIQGEDGRSENENENYANMVCKIKNQKKKI